MKNLALRSRQRGLSFIGLVFLVAIIVSVVAIGAQSVPVFLEYQAITKAANKAAAEGNTVAEVKAAFTSLNVSSTSNLANCENGL